MKRKLSITIIIISVTCTFCSVNESFIIKNKIFKREYFVSANKPGSVNVLQIDNSSNKVILNTQKTPLFEFVLNKQLSSDYTAKQITGFSSEPSGKITQTIPINTELFFSVLHSDFLLQNDSVSIELNFYNNFSSDIAFILPSENQGITFQSHTGRIKKINFPGNGIENKCGTTGEQISLWSSENGSSVIDGIKGHNYDIIEENNKFTIRVNVDDTSKRVQIARST